MNNVLKAKELLESLVGPTPRKGSSWVGGLKGSDGVVFHKVKTALRLLNEETGQGNWQIIENGHRPAKGTIFAEKVWSLSVNIAVFDGNKVYHGASYDYEANEWLDCNGDAIEGATHFIEQNPTPPNQLKIGDKDE